LCAPKSWQEAGDSFIVYPSPPKKMPRSVWWPLYFLFLPNYHSYVTVHHSILNYICSSPGFNPRSGNVGFVVDEVALEQVFSQYFGFSCQFSFHQLH
jgi:hypothetical protein